MVTRDLAKAHEFFKHDRVMTLILLYTKHLENCTE